MTDLHPQRVEARGAAERRLSSSPHGTRDVKAASAAVYHWAREIHPSRLRAIQGVAWTYALLRIGANQEFPYPVHGLHWIRPKEGREIAPSFLWQLPTGLVRVHPYIVTTREWFARQVMSRAVASARRRYPDWESHEFLRGTRLGERVLAFDHPVAHLADHHVDQAFYHYAEKQKPTIAAFWHLLRPTPGSWQRYDPVQLDRHRESPPPNRVLLIVVDTPHRTKEIVSQAVTAWRSNTLPRSTPAAGSFGYKDIKEELTWLTPAERVLLHWEGVACPDPERPDARLFEAAESVDVARVRSALDAGADPNALHPTQGTAMNAVVSAASVDEGLTARCIDALSLLWGRGANVNVHTPNHPPPLTDAMLAKNPTLIRWLMDHGADDTICDLNDAMPGILPSAWDVALADFELDEASSAETLAALASDRPTPRFTQAEDDELRARIADRRR